MTKLAVIEQTGGFVSKDHGENGLSASILGDYLG